LTNVDNKVWIRTVTGLLLLMGCILIYGEAGQAQVLTNRTPDTARIYPSPSPLPTPSTIQADPLLIAPDPAAIRSQRQPELSYYVLLRDVSRVVVSDAQGTTDDIFQPGFEKKIASATYNFVGPDSVYIVLRSNRSYSIIFESSESLMYLEIVKRRGNSLPEQAIRYRDLSLGGGKARLEITAEAVESLHLDTNHDGSFETLLKPTVRLRGSAARNTSGPKLRFRILDGDLTSLLVSIEATDIGNGVKSIFYSFDGQRAFPYQAPIRIDRKRTSFIWVFAEDNAANRSAIKFKF
jgi:hypothetical protein